jgi:hypothetical protein
LLCQSYATFASRTVLRDENCRGVYQQFPFWFASKPAVGNSSLATSHSPPYSSSFFSHSCALFLRFFAHTQNSTLFFSRDSALFARNHRGGGRDIC